MGYRHSFNLPKATTSCYMTDMENMSEAELKALMFEAKNRFQLKLGKDTPAGKARRAALYAAALVLEQYIDVDPEKFMAKWNFEDDESEIMYFDNDIFKAGSKYRDFFNADDCVAYERGFVRVHFENTITLLSDVLRYKDGVLQKCFYDAFNGLECVDVANEKKSDDAFADEMAIFYWEGDDIDISNLLSSKGKAALAKYHDRIEKYFVEAAEFRKAAIKLRLEATVWYKKIKSAYDAYRAAKDEFYDAMSSQQQKLAKQIAIITE